jgi:hypothetical protein
MLFNYWHWLVVIGCGWLVPVVNSSFVYEQWWIFKLEKYCYLWWDSVTTVSNQGSGSGFNDFVAGLWIRIDSIWIQKFSSIRIRIHSVIESASNLDTDPDPHQYLRRQIFSKIKESKKSKILAVCTIFIPFRYKNKNQFKKSFFSSFSCPGIRTPNPDPQSHWIRIHNPALWIRIRNPDPGARKTKKKIHIFLTYKHFIIIK